MQWIQRVLTMAAIMVVVVPGTRASADDGGYLYLYPEEDGTIWTILELSGEPAETDRVSEALGVMMGERDESYIAEYYDGIEAETAIWSAYWYDALDVRAGSVDGALSLEPLRDVLQTLGYARLDIVVYTPPHYALTVTWSKPALNGGSDKGYHWGTFSLEAPLPTITVTCNRVAASSPAHYLPVPLVLLLFAIAVVQLRRSVLRRPAAEAGYGCYICTRVHLYLVAVLWLALAVAIWLWSPLEPFVYGIEGLADYYQPLLLVTLVAVSTLAAVASRVYLLPVYLRIPGAAWRARDFAMQALWYSLFAGTVVIAVGVLVAGMDRGPVFILGVLFVGAIAAAYCYLRTLISLGFTLQSLDEGELLARVVQLAQTAKIPNFRSAYMAYRDKSPVLNAMAANQMRIVFSETLVNHLTRREVDGVIGHEMIHLARNHPALLYRLRIVAYVVAVFAGGALSIPLLVGLSLVMPQYPNVIGFITLLGAAVPGLVVGLLFYLRICRKYEYEADAGALGLVKDPEAQIAGLVKLCQLNYMPLDWGGKWANRLLTHPSTRERAKCIAERGDVPRERLEALLAGESVGEGHYDIPASAGPDRVFTTGFKSRVQLLNLLVTTTVPALAAVGMVWIIETLVPNLLPPPIVLILLVLCSTLALLVSHNRCAMRGLQALAKRFRSRHDLPENAGVRTSFVSLTPSDRAVVYDGFSNWDVGLVALGATQLHFLGDGVAFSLSRAAIQDINMVSTRFTVIPARRIRLSFRLPEDNDVRVVTFACAETGSLLGANRETCGLFETLCAWQNEEPEREETALPNAPYPPPADFAVRGVPAMEALGLPQVLLAGGLSLMAGCAFGVFTGLPSSDPLGASALGAGVASGAATLLTLLPCWRWARAQGTAEA